MEGVFWIGRGITFPLRDSSIEPEELSHSDTDRSESEGCTKPGQKGAFWEYQLVKGWEGGIKWVPNLR